VKKQFLHILVAGLTLSACDSGPADDGLVSVRYAVSSETGASANMLYLDEFGEPQGAVVQDGWEYAFRVEEGSQLVYMWTTNVVGGVIEASIIIDEEVRRSYEHGSDPNGTQETQFGTAAWGPNSNIELIYLVSGSRIMGETTVSTTSGVKRFAPDGDYYYGDYYQVNELLTVREGFQATVETSREPIEVVDGMASWQCVEASISMRVETVDLPFPLLLSKAEQCDVVPISISLSAVVPGY
jgi:hypothetical protein